MKKSLLITLDFPPNLGGVAAYYYQVCKNCPDKIVVLAPKQPGDKEFDSRQNFLIIRTGLLNLAGGPKLLGLRKIIHRSRCLNLIKRLPAIIEKYQIELLQIGQVLPLGTVALMLQKTKPIPYLFYAHGLDITLPQRFARKKFWLKKIIAKSQSIIANSYFTKDELVKLGANAEKITVIWPCPNLTAEHVSRETIQKKLKKYGLQNKKIIFTVGRLVKRKGHDLVIKALPQILKAVPDVCYVIIGTGPEEKNLKQLAAEKKLYPDVKFLGAVPQAELALWYEVGEVFIMPSRQLANGDVEGFGIVYLEANLFGTPVIGGKSGGVGEAIVDGRTGLLVNSTDVNEIAEAVIKLLTNPPYAHRLGIQGAERVHEEFDWARQAEKIKEIID